MVDRSSDSSRYVDPLAPLLASLRVEGLVLASTQLSPPWGFRAEGFDDVAFYFTASGSACLQHGAQYHSVGPGELIIVAPATPHALQDQPGSGAVSLRSLDIEAGRAMSLLTSNVPGATRLILGCFRFNQAQRDLLFSCLPPVVHLRASDSDASCSHLLGALAAEACADVAGGDPIKIRLAEALFVHALRSCVRGSVPARGWLRALSDAQLSRALTAFHLAPEKRWSVASLAAAAGMSRSAFASRFSDTVGQPPLAYIKAWRIALAATLLGSESVTLKRIARRVGYSSDESFNRAFRRVMGAAPGAYRLRLRNPTPR